MSHSADEFLRHLWRPTKNPIIKTMMEEWVRACRGEQPKSRHPLLLRLRERGRGGGRTIYEELEYPTGREKMINLLKLSRHFKAE